MAKEENMSLQHSGAVRLFSPNELLHLFGFPDSYSFPSSMTTRHKYRAIGQSINKIVVQMLMHSELCRLNSSAAAHNQQNTGQTPDDFSKKRAQEHNNENEVDCKDRDSKKIRKEDGVA